MNPSTKRKLPLPKLGLKKYYSFVASLEVLYMRWQVFSCKSQGFATKGLWLSCGEDSRTFIRNDLGTPLWLILRIVSIKYKGILICCSL